MARDGVKIRMGLLLRSTHRDRSRPVRMNVDEFLKRSVNRRQFLGSSAKNAAVAAGMVGLAGATAVAASSTKATASERVRIATIGVRNQGKALTSHLASLPDVG